MVRLDSGSRLGPYAIVSRIGSPDERICQTTIAELSSIAALPAPSLLVVGEVDGVV